MSSSSSSPHKKGVRADIDLFVVETGTAIDDRNEALNRVIEWVRGPRHSCSGASIRERLTELIAKHMKDFLSGDSVDAQRSRASLLFGRVVDTLASTPSTSVFDPALVKFLHSFFLSRLDDFHSLQGSLIALLALSKLNDLTREKSASEVLEALKKVHVPQMTVELRLLCHKLFSVLIQDTRFLDSIQSIEPASDQKCNDLVLQFCDMMDEESDPRCLKICFVTGKTMVTKFDAVLNEATFERLFEVTECYVPIEFSPPPNDTRGVTQDDLVGGLRGIFKASLSMARDVLDMVRDRLEAEDSNAVVKSDVLQTLAICLPMYCSGDTKTIAQWMTRCLQPVLQLVIDCILSGGEDAVVDSAVGVIYAMAKQITVCPNIIPYFDGCLNIFVKEAVGDAETLRGDLSARALVAAASASSYTFERVMRLFFPAAKDRFLATNLPERKDALIQHIATLLSTMDPDVISGYNASTKGPQTEKEDASFVGGGIGVMIRNVALFVQGPLVLYCAFQRPQSRKFVIDILRMLVVGSPVVLLSTDSVKEILEVLFDFVDSRRKSKPTGDLDSAWHKQQSRGDTLHALNALVAIAKREKIFTEQVIAELLPSLLETAGGLKEEISGDVSQALETLGLLCRLPEVFVETVPILLGRACNLLRENSTDNAESESSTGFVLFRAVCNIVHRNACNSDTIQWIVTGASSMSEGREGKEPASATTVPVLDHFVKLIVDQNSVLPGVTPALCSDLLETIRRVIQNLPETLKGRTIIKIISSTRDIVPSLIEKEISQNAYRCFHLLSIAICSTPKEVVLAIPLLHDLFCQLCHVAKVTSSEHSNTNYQKVSCFASQAVASIVNKIPRDSKKQLEEYVAAVGYDSEACFVPGNILQHAELLGWVSKALLMRRHKDGIRICLEFCNVITSSRPIAFSDTEISAAIQSIEIIVRDSKAALCVDCSVQSSSFFKHSLFRKVFPILLQCVDSFGQDSLNRRFHAVHAILALVEHSPLSVVHSELGRLVPVIVLALTSGSSVLQVSCLPVFLMLLKNGEADSIVPNAESCVENLLRICSQEYLPLVCVPAIKCLSLLSSSLPQAVALRLQKRIISGLYSVLDHPSQQVRGAAVACRNQWFAHST